MPAHSTSNLPGSIRNRILIFSILVTLVPAIGMGWFWYDISKKTTTEKVEQKLLASASLLEREIELWFKERHHDLRVFSSSFVIADNLVTHQVQVAESSPESQKKSQMALRKMSTYLHLISSKFSKYNRLAIVDPKGKVLAASDHARHQYIVIPDNWRQQIEVRRYFLSRYSFADPAGATMSLVGIPLYSNTKDTHIGFMVLEVRLDSILSLLDSSFQNHSTRNSKCGVRLLEKDGRRIFPLELEPVPDPGKASSNGAAQLFQTPYKLRQYTNDCQVRVVGLAYPFSTLPWAILIEEKSSEVFAGLESARNRILLITTLLTIVIGGTAIIIARHIIIPLEVLTAGVLEVARGKLDIHIPIHRKDELGIVTETFNDMVVCLREAQQQLEEMATTDPLTGLANRKQIMTSLNLQMEAFCRYGTDFSILLLDIDFFKKVNDTYGHQAGDAVLVEMADILRETLRTLDTAGRYGGEEFIVILDTTDRKQAVKTAERIRYAVETHLFHWQKTTLNITVSIGVAAISVDDQTVDSIIAKVDSALYKAKDHGRNRVWLDTTNPSSASSTSRLMPPP